MFNTMNPEAYSADYAEYEALKQELNAQDAREWKESRWSDADGNKILWQIAEDNNGEYIHTLTIDSNGIPLRFEDWDISELNSMSR